MTKKITLLTTLAKHKKLLNDPPNLPRMEGGIGSLFGHPTEGAPLSSEMKQKQICTSSKQKRIIKATHGKPMTLKMIRWHAANERLIHDQNLGGHPFRPKPDPVQDAIARTVRGEKIAEKSRKAAELRRKQNNPSR